VFTGGLRRLGAGALVLARHRLELAALDVEEEVLRAGALLAGMLAVAALAALALAAAAALAVVALWPYSPLGALGGVAALFGAAAVIGFLRLRAALARKPAFLAATLHEMESDARLLEPKA
jgi:uncharacterized membrane protein YqjE